MAQLMVSSGKSTLPWVPKRVVAVFQPHRYSRTAQFMERFAEALGSADEVLVAPLYSAGESAIEGVSSAALAEKVQQAGQSARALADMDSLVEAVQQCSSAGDLVLVMGAGDVNQLWSRLQSSADQDGLATAA
jgi:UDP-N-acetylmuramate--alanine ligase